MQGFVQKLQALPLLLPWRLRQSHHPLLRGLHLWSAHLASFEAPGKPSLALLLTCTYPHTGQSPGQHAELLHRFLPVLPLEQLLDARLLREP